ncbi:MAG: glycosyltransferase [Lachnospiraceae bacterium]|nr:glycosyltransferase [Lachnospiraceae bacterium]
MDKIVFVIPDMPGGGTERVVALLANEYCDRGREVGILLFAGHDTAYPLRERVEVVSVGEPSGGRIRSRLARLRRMRRYYRENRNCQIWAFSVMGTVFSAIAAIGQRHLFLVSERNDPNQYDHKKLRNLFYRRADVVVCQTPDAAGSFPAGIAARSVVIPNPIEAGGTEPYDGVREKRIVAVGRLNPQKNHRLLLKAFAGFVKRHSDYVLEVYGKGELEEELKQYAVQLEIADKVVWKGFSDHVKEDINRAAMFVLSSDYEGVSNSMLEAMAQGVPVISTDCPIGGSKMYIQDHINGILVPVRDDRALLDAMLELAGDAELSRRISMACRRLREENTVAQIADRFLDTVSAVSDRKRV